MKFIIIGLGNFGSSLGLKLVEEGHEVIGVDNRMEPVNLHMDKLTHTICLDTTDEAAIQKLPLSDADYVLVSIGEDVGSSITSTALIKKYSNAKIISRALSPIHQTILETMGIDDIIHPEAEYAAQLANRLVIKGALKSLILDDKFEIVELVVPPPMVGKTIEGCNFRQEWMINVVTLIRQHPKKNILGKAIKAQEVVGVLKPDTLLMADDIMVIFGRNNDIQRFISAHI